MSTEFWTRDILQGSFSAAVKRVWRWYRQEFINLFSPATIARLTDRGDRVLIVKAGERELWCMGGRHNQSWRLSSDEIAASSLEEALAQRDLARKVVRIGMEMDASAFFVRRFDIPSAALASLPKLLIADIERKTPFKISDVLYGSTVAKDSSSPDKVHVTLWILRRDLAIDAAVQARLQFSDIAFIRPVGGDPIEYKPVIELDGQNDDAYWVRRIAVTLGAVTVFFFIAGILITLWRQATIQAELDTKIHEMTARASDVRRVVDKTSAEGRLLTVLRTARHSAPLFADLWEETARILPDSAFITDMVLAEAKPGERTLDLVGFASSAAGLPAVFNKSPLFADAALTAPITPDPQEKREGFSLRAKIERNAPETAK